jgi:hypothetical protein
MLLLTLSLGCQRAAEPPHGSEAARPAAEPVDPKLPSHVEVAAPDAPRALKKGFYGVEGGKWRWTAPAFEAKLAPPKLVLRLRFTLPQPALAQMKQVTLSAKLNGVALPPETYDHAGEFVYTRRIDPTLLGGPATVEFSLDKQFTPGGADSRALGLIVYSVGFEIE